MRTSAPRSSRHARCRSDDNPSPVLMGERHPDPVVAYGGPRRSGHDASAAAEARGRPADVGLTAQRDDNCQDCCGVSRQRRAPWLRAIRVDSRGRADLTTETATSPKHGRPTNDSASTRDSPDTCISTDIKPPRMRGLVRTPRVGKTQSSPVPPHSPGVQRHNGVAGTPSMGSRPHRKRL